MGLQVINNLFIECDVSRPMPHVRPLLIGRNDSSDRFYLCVACMEATSSSGSRKCMAVQPRHLIANYHVWLLVHFCVCYVADCYTQAPGSLLGPRAECGHFPCVAAVQVRVLQALLQNTQEQVVLAVLAHGAFVALAPPDWLGLIPTYTVLFVAGRVLFAAGYAGGAAGRALGFALTFMPSMAMCVASLVMLLSDPL